MDNYKMEVDDSGINYQPNQATAVEMFKKELYKMPNKFKVLKPNPRVSQGINIDESGTRLQLDDPGMVGPMLTTSNDHLMVLLRNQVDEAMADDSRSVAR